MSPIFELIRSIKRLNDAFRNVVKDLKGNGSL